MIAEPKPGHDVTGRLLNDQSSPRMRVPRSHPPVAPKPLMREKELSFVIPTHRLRDVGETIEQYDEHFWRNGHAVRMVVFDDSTPTNQQKYYPLLEQTRTHQELHYVGPREKENFLAYLTSRLRDKRLEGLVRNLFRPSYGGNRNCALMFTLARSSSARTTTCARTR